MGTFHESMLEYHAQLQKGNIQKAYKGLMDFMQTLKAHFQKVHPEFQVPGSLYFGYMDMTYFALIPEAFKDRKLKIAVVFLHQEARFELWLSAANRRIGADYWELFTRSGWCKYHLVSSPQGSDSIIEYIITAAPDFNNLDALTQQIDSAAVEFISEIEKFLAAHKI